VKFLCDECVDQPIVDALRAAGHAVSYVAEMSPGISDDEVLVRLHGIDPAEKARIAVAAIAEHVDDLAGAFTVIEKDRLRIRRSWTT
jgi:hypothetical protein